MPRIVYVDGAYRQWSDAAVSAEDRGFQFGDAVYEVCEVRDGALIDETRHMNRLERSLRELMIEPPMSRGSWARVLRETIRRNRVRDGSVYLQVSRGAAPREFLFPAAHVRPTVVVVARHAKAGLAEERARTGIGVITHPDIRWGRCDIKTVMLLPASLAKEAAKAKGAREAWLVDDAGFVTEGASSNAWIVTKDRQLVTRHADSAILRGVTRTTVVDVARKLGVELVERPFTVAEAKGAAEAFITSASNIVTPVVRIDADTVGDGKPGRLSQALRQAFYAVAEHARA